MVHCQDGSNPPSPAPPLVLGTLLPHFISGKFSRLLAQTQGRISRRGICVRSSPHRSAPASCGELAGQPQRCGERWGAAARAVQPPRAACIAPLPGHRGASPSSHPIPAMPCTGTCRLRKHAEAPSCAHCFSAPPQDGQQRRVSKESGSCPPPLPPSCPGLRPEGLASSSNLICFRSQATQIAFCQAETLHLEPGSSTGSP